jgi:hypothetical protein
LVKSSEEKKPLGRSRHRWEDNNNKFDFIEIRCQNMDGVLLAQDRGRLLLTRQ